ncbi:MAG: serine/threonine protein kinase [Actinobacteria bacterium]|nr:serine/threonine protein kinase [Actinomycetota bacterium]
MVDAPKLLGRYQLGERIASGAMGSVYSATDERLGREVAVKLLKEELVRDDRFVERFRREARAVAALNHPSIASVYDYGEDEDHYFIVMELAPGLDLARLLGAEGTLDPQRTRMIGAQICDALASAHLAGVIHRDIKPANVIVGTDDRVKVTDFGIARAAGDSTLTATGSVLGTAHYISPEQASGHPLGPASDIYSLGIVLYEMLTGTFPFAGESALAIAMHHVSDEVPAPSSVNPEVPEDLDHAVGRATAKVPEDRFDSAEAMANALRGHADPDATVVAAPATMPATQELTGADTRVAPGTQPYTSASGQAPAPAERGARGRPRIGATGVIIGLIVLLLLAGALILPRITSNDEPAPSGATADPGGGGNTGGGGNSAGGTDSGAPETACGATPCALEEAVIGAPYQEVEDVLRGQGYQVEVQPTASDQSADTIIETDPAPGTPLDEGQTVVLVVAESTG